MSTSKITSLDLCGLKQRIEKSDDAEKAQRENPEGYRRGFDPADPAAHGKIDLKRIKDDPVARFFFACKSRPQVMLILAIPAGMGRSFPL